MSVLHNDDEDTWFHPAWKIGNKKIEVVTYGANWKGMVNRTTPFFASRINRSPGNVKREEEGAYWTGNILDYQQHVPFAFCSDKSTACVMAETKYSNKMATPDEPFSFLAVDEVPGSNNVKLASGVVSHESVILSDGGSRNFKVRKDYDDDGDYFVVTLDPEFDVASNQVPTVLVFPRVDDRDYPENVREIALYVKYLNSHEFIVRASDTDSDPDHTHVGFNLLVISPNTDNVVIKHGFVNGIEDDSIDHTLEGIQISAIDCTRNTSEVNEDVDVFSFYDYSFKERVSESRLSDVYLPPVVNPRKFFSVVGRGMFGFERSALANALSSRRHLLKEENAAVSKNNEHDTSRKLIFGLAANLVRGAYENTKQTINNAYNAIVDTGKETFERVGEGFVGVIDDVNEIVVQPIRDVTNGIGAIILGQNADENRHFKKIFPSEILANTFGGYGNFGKRTVEAVKGGVRVDFLEHFDQIPAVIVTPVVTAGTECRHRAEEIEDNPIIDVLQQIINAITGEVSDVNVVTTYTLLEDILQCQVETITTEYCYVKCVCIGESKSIIPLSCSIFSRVPVVIKKKSFVFCIKNVCIAVSFL